MSILIKGTKMPKDCFECPLYNLDYVCVILKRQNLAFDKPPDCPLVEILPHGDLVDVDNLIEDIEELDDCEPLKKWLKRFVYGSAVVIESEGE